ncbi:MAG: TrpR-like protein, YerC/YecD [Firmicutes bacterium]|nr:TrpR-like protein, YerC/YecD [Bacillota bacterium]
MKKSPHKDYLFRAILSLKTVDECYDFFEDLTTVKELDEMSKRIRVATLLLDDKVYSEILGEGGEVSASSATISRVNRCIKYGNGGYKTVIDRLKADGVELPEAKK